MSIFFLSLSHYTSFTEGGKRIKLFKKEAVRIMSACKAGKFVTMHAVILDCSLARLLKRSLTLTLQVISFGVTRL